MKKTILLLLLLMVACAPTQPTVQDKGMEKITEPQITTKEEVITTPPTPPVQAQAEEAEPQKIIDLYSQIGCGQLLTAEEFAKECGKTADDIIVTYRTGTRNCMVNVKDRQNERLTSGISLTGYTDKEAATKEFDRRLVVLKVGADKSVGERAYTPPIKMVDREALEFIRDNYIVEAGTDTRLCPKAGLQAISRIVDSRLQ
ncbi:hypothetical protein KY309_01555 [Candidatus Woesearchaeota archaeon]|nr:hypothetical protein [Candidatus Woesearchaeota archaeon]MBW3016274.1 hypothetical protein [Candidatus Woesearchaeota archaeon]